jgi:hypothetical protein
MIGQVGPASPEVLGHLSRVPRTIDQLHKHPPTCRVGQRSAHPGKGSQVHLNRYSHSCTIQGALNQPNSCRLLPGLDFSQVSVLAVKPTVARLLPPRPVSITAYHRLR